MIRILPLVAATFVVSTTATSQDEPTSAPIANEAVVDEVVADDAAADRADADISLSDASVIRDMIVLTVDKTALKAELRTHPPDLKSAQVLKTFRIAIGKSEGDKLVEGDNRTPEGIYFAQSHIPGRTLPAKYGPLAIPIDFPNPMDRIDRRTGHGIWLHGVDRAQRIEEAKVTEGCVAFYNSDIDRLAAWLRSHQGVIVIADDASRLNDPAAVQQVTAATESWMQAWQNRRIDDYIGHYADGFQYANYDRGSYRAYKDRVFNQYKKMNVTFDNLRVIVHPKYAVSIFNQDFRGDDRFVSDGRKILYWERGEGGAWRIRREVFEKRRFETVAVTAAELALLSDTTSGIPSEKEAKDAPSL